MFAAFLRTSMVSPPRQIALRKAAIGHCLFLALLSYAACSQATLQTMTMVGQALICAAIVEGAVMAGWRLTQMPKSQALEFLLTSPLQPRRLFMQEAAIGLGRYALVQLSGLPFLLGLVLAGRLETPDLWAFFALPFVWGIVAGLGLTVWAYESIPVKRVGELVALGGVLFYLLVGVLAGERLREWLVGLPDWIGSAFFDGFRGFHEHNPFGVVQYWMTRDRVPGLAWESLFTCLAIGVGLSTLFLFRAAFRLRGHFADLHYRPFATQRPDQVGLIGETPLSWWAVKRVMEFSGRINIWLAGGFSLLYAAYTVAGDAWPPWMGRLVFEIFEKMGGIPALITGLTVLAAVPAAFQYGLWDSNAQDRCRRLELLLLTDLNGRDYWNAAFRAAWVRGRGYMAIATVLWLAMLLAGKIGYGQMAVSIAAAVVVWRLSFVVGFLAFSQGRQANGLGSILTLGVPLLVFVVYRQLGPAWAMMIPHGCVYTVLVDGVSWTCLLLAVYAAGSWQLKRVALAGCEANLRKWMDANQGLHAAA